MLPKTGRTAYNSHSQLGGRLTIQPGTRLRPYEVASLIGAGGMGEVYKARDTQLDRIATIKVLPQHLADQPDLLNLAKLVIQVPPQHHQPFSARRPKRG